MCVYVGLRLRKYIKLRVLLHAAGEVSIALFVMYIDCSKYLAQRGALSRSCDACYGHWVYHAALFSALVIHE